MNSMHFNTWIVLCNHQIVLCNHHHNQDTEQFHRLRKNFCVPFHYHYKFPHPHPLVITDLFSITVVLSSWDCYINGMIEYVTFWNWLLSLSRMLLRFIQIVGCINSPFIQIVACINSPFILILNILLLGYITIYLSIHTLKDIWVVSSFCQSWIELL